MKKTHRIITYLAVIALCAITSKAVAQNEFSGVVSLDKTIHNFGVILLSDGEQHCTFTVTNIQKRPIIIHKVISSCGCTDPTWTKSPIMPGEKGEINITYTNDQGPYPFDKSITVYISDLNKPINLRVRGIVQEKRKSIKETYTERIGQLGLTEATIDAGQIEQGLSRNGSFTIANTGKKAIDVKFTDLSAGLNLKPAQIKIDGEKTAEISYTIETSKTGRQLWGHNAFTATVVINGTAQKSKIAIDAMIKENFSSLSKDQRKIGSLPYFEESSYNFGTIKSGETKEISLSFTNNGKSDFIIYKADCEEKGITFEYPQKTGYNGKGTFKIRLDSTGKKGEILYVITLVTNSPLRPIINLLVTGIVE